MSTDNLNPRQFFNRVGWGPQFLMEGTHAETAKVGKLVATQPSLSSKRVQHYVDHPSSEPIVVYRHHDKIRDAGKAGDELRIYDGHHRAAAAIQQGEKTVPVRVVDFPGDASRPAKRQRQREHLPTGRMY